MVWINKNYKENFGRSYFIISIIDLLLLERMQLQTSIQADDADRRTMVDRAVRKTCSDQSLKTMMEICFRCLLNKPADRPSVEDVLWNLQFASQIQDEWQGVSQSSEGSPISLSAPPNLHLTYN